VVVLGGQDLLARADHQAVVDEREPGRGVGGQRDLFGPGPQVARERALDRRDRILRILAVEQQVLERERIGVERPSPALDRRAHGAWMRDQEEAAEVEPVRIELELGAHPLPVDAPFGADERSRGAHGFVTFGSARRRRRNQCGRPCGDGREKAAAVERHGILLTMESGSFSVRQARRTAAMRSRVRGTSRQELRTETDTKTFC